MEHITTSPKIIRDFLTYLETIQGKSPKTVEEYYFDLRLFFRFLLLKKKHPDFSEIAKDTVYFESLSIAEVTLNDLEQVELGDLYEYMNFLVQYRGIAANSRARKTSSLRSYYKYLSTKANVIKNNPTTLLEIPKQKKSLPRYLTLKESIALLNAIDGPTKVRDYAIVTLFLNCGMRLSELSKIDIKDIQEDKITLTGKGNKERSIYLNPACLNAIDAYLKVRPANDVIDKNALFISGQKKRISVKTVQWLVKKHIANAGLNDTKYSVHKLRHTAATLMYQHGNTDLRSLQQILGHEQLSTTQIYTHLSDEKLKKAAMDNPLSTIENANLNEPIKQRHEQRSKQTKNAHANHTSDELNEKDE